MKSPPAHKQPQFRTDAGLSNLDRCNWCGEVRAAHGPDWSCPAKRESLAPVILLIAGSVLAAAGALIWTGSKTAPPSLNMLGAIFVGVGVVIDVAAVITLQRRRHPGGG